MEASKENTYGIHKAESVVKYSARDDSKNFPKKN
jgi:hypothetical protein